MVSPAGEADARAGDLVLLAVTLAVLAGEADSRAEVLAVLAGEADARAGTVVM